MHVDVHGEYVVCCVHSRVVEGSWEGIAGCVVHVDVSHILSYLVASFPGLQHLQVLITFSILHDGENGLGMRLSLYCTP